MSTSRVHSGFSTILFICRRFPFIDDPDRRANTAMVAFMDEIVGDITTALKAKKMWDKTFLIWSSDNVSLDADATVSLQSVW